MIWRKVAMLFQRFWINRFENGFPEYRKSRSAFTIYTCDGWPGGFRKPGTLSDPFDKLQNSHRRARSIVENVYSRYFGTKSTAEALGCFGKFKKPSGVNRAVIGIWATAVSG